MFEKERKGLRFSELYKDNEGLRKSRHVLSLNGENFMRTYNASNIYCTILA